MSRTIEEARELIESFAKLQEKNSHNMLILSRCGEDRMTES